jgi:hypothetical protein
MKTILLLALFSFAQLVSAQSNINMTLKDSVEVGAFKHGIGSTFNLSGVEAPLKKEVVFLGNVVRSNGEEYYKMLLSKENKKIVFVEESFFTRKSKSQQTIIDPYIQVGSTCTGYAINGFLHQMNLAQFTGTGALKDELSTEEGRAQLLAHAINEYYMTPSRKYSIRAILNNYGKKYGFKCKMLKTSDYSEAKELVIGHLKLGLPVVVSFNIGPKMVTSPFPLSIYQKENDKVDERLWIPRRVGERNIGGHTIVAAGSFELNNKTYLTMLDSDWNEPRVWDMEESLNHPKTALEEVEFITCQ